MEHFCRSQDLSVRCALNTLKCSMLPFFLLVMRDFYGDTVKSITEQMVQKEVEYRLNRSAIKTTIVNRFIKCKIYL